MLNGAIVKEIQAKVPEQYRPKGTDEDWFSKAFKSARGNETDPAADEQRYRDALDHHNLSMRAADDGERTTATGKVVTGSGAVMAREHQAVIEQKKRDDEEREYAARNAMTAMKQRLQDIADEWGKIADEYERKLGGINKIGEQLGVKRKPDQSEEEYRRFVNEMILTKIANGEIATNSDMAKMARARDNEYEALEAGQEAEALIQAGKTEEAERLVERLERKALIQRKANELNSVQVNEVIDAEIIRGNAMGTVENLSTNETEQRDEASIDFWETENGDFAASAQALAVTESFNIAAEGQVAAPIPEIELNQQVQFTLLKPAGMMGA